MPSPSGLQNGIARMAHNCIELPIQANKEGTIGGSAEEEMVANLINGTSPTINTNKITVPILHKEQHIPPNQQQQIGMQGGGTGAATTTYNYAVGTTEVIPGGTGATAINTTGESGPQETPHHTKHEYGDSCGQCTPLTTPTTSGAMVTAPG